MRFTSEWILFIITWLPGKTGIWNWIKLNEFKNDSLFVYDEYREMNFSRDI